MVPPGRGFPIPGRLRARKALRRGSVRPVRCIGENAESSQESGQFHYGAWPLFGAIYRETNRASMKKAFDLLGIDSGELLLRLMKACDETRAKMAEALKQLRDGELKVQGSD